MADAKQNGLVSEFDPHQAQIMQRPDIYERAVTIRNTGVADRGFTLIELLIVIVVLGILAAVVVFSLGSVTGKSAIAACQADGATVNTAIAAYYANNGAYPTSISNLTSTVAATSPGGPYIQSWPNNTTHYKFYLGTSGDFGVGNATSASPGTTWTGAGTCTATTVS
jgi:prepilin-type N-terminal cleavage/methylation domain-containing protein